MLNNPIIIAIAGKPRSGKDTICSYIMSRIPLQRYGPSVAVKRATAALFDIPEDYLYDDKMKEKIDLFWGISYRQMAQMTGKESSRDVHGDDFWMRHVDRYLENHLPEDTKGIILADVRYANELEWAKKRGGITINVTRENRPQAANESHPAEQGLPDNLFNVVIRNDDTLKALYKKVDLLLNNLEQYTPQHSTNYHII